MKHSPDQNSDFAIILLYVVSCYTQLHHTEIWCDYVELINGASKNIKL